MAWQDLVGYEFLRTTSASFADANGQPVSFDPADLQLEEGDVITEAVVRQLEEAGVDVGRLGTVAVRNFRQDHQMGLFNDRTRLTANLGIALSRDIDARLGYKMTRRHARGYDHGLKFLPQYNNQTRRNIDLFNGSVTHRLSPRFFYVVRGSYSHNRFYDYLYEEQLDADDPFRFGRLFPPSAVIGAFDTEGLSDAEGGNNYDFDGFQNVNIYAGYPRLLDGDLGDPFRLANNIDLDGDGSFDVYRGDRLSPELLSQLQSLFETLDDDELAERRLNRNLIPIMAPPTENDYTERKIKDFQVSLDVTAQVNERNMVSAGIDYRRLDLFDYFIFANDRWDGTTDPSDPDNPPIRPVDETFVDAQPYEVAAYVEDKLEFSNLVVRPGLRLDVLDPNMSTVVGYGAGGAVRRGEAEPAETSVKWRLSPRLGVAFPITDRARLSFNYGQFLQYPEYQRLYQNVRTASWVPGAGYVPVDEFGFDLGFETYVGNPNIEPERTIFYQIDGEFLVNESFKLGASLFYKDIYDYVTFVRQFAGGGDAFWVLSNLDYANARGVEVRAEKRLVEHFGFTTSYTYSRSVGNADDANGAFNDWYSNSVSGTIPPKGAQPLDWDQPHTLSFTAFSRFGGLGGSLIGRFGSGLPYTPTTTRGLPTGPKNSQRRPWTGVLDLRLSYDLALQANAYFRPFVDVTNLLDRENVLNVYSDTGSPNVTTDPGTQFEDAHRPFYLGPPRHVTVGFQIGF